MGRVFFINFTRPSSNKYLTHIVLSMREAIKSRILKRVDSFQEGYRQNIGLIGPVGVGKTRLLLEIFQNSVGHSQLIPVFISCPSISLESLLEKWSVQVLRGIFLSQQVLAPASLESLMEAADPIAPKTVEKIRQLRRTLSRERHFSTRDLFHLTGLLAEETGKRVLFILDEIHALTQVLEGDVFGVLGKEIMIEKNTLFAFSSSETRHAVEIFREKLALLFSNFELFPIDSFTFEEGLELLREKLEGIQVTFPQRRFLVHLTGAHPFYLERIADQMRNQVHQGSTPFSHAATLHQQSMHFITQAISEELFQPMGPLSLTFEKRLEVCFSSAKDRPLIRRAILAVSEGYAKASEVALAMDTKVADAKKILVRLVEQGLISQNGTLYYFHDTLFSFWLREVYRRRFEIEMPQPEAECSKFQNSLMSVYQKYIAHTGYPLDLQLEHLLKRFHHDRLDLGGKKFCLPPFSEFVRVAISSESVMLVARSRDVRWAFQIFTSPVVDKDITAFLIRTKSQSRPISKKILVALDGMEHHAKLLAQELKIQIWSRPEYNALVRLGQLPEAVIRPDEESHETIVGALAENVYSA